MCKLARVRRGKFRSFQLCLPTLLAVEEGDKHVAITGFNPCNDPSLLASIFGCHLVHPTHR